ncbi:uncharacterized protein A4U43_C05F4020 [Asparagus officinalis]|uniref:Protein GPR107 n=1 Tax=Asparagus officinalis TaxID=4686 RepID=A0A5P1ETE3_ASPOF|nr:uncharacterized protein A4U43_C05F4020 [Asparagus officinalis]
MIPQVEFRSIPYFAGKKRKDQTTPKKSQKNHQKNGNPQTPHRLPPLSPRRLRRRRDQGTPIVTAPAPPPAPALNLLEKKCPPSPSHAQTADNIAVRRVSPPPPRRPLPSRASRLLASNLKTLAVPSQNPSPNPSSSCVLSRPYIRLLFTFRDLSPPHFNSYNRTFPIAISDDDDLFFANCVPGSKVSMSVRSVLYNLFPDGSRDFLPVGRAPVPTACGLFSLIYVAFSVVWVHFGLIRNRSSAHGIHYLMAGLLFAKALNLVFKAEDQHYVRITGTPHGWDVLFYLFQFIKGVLFFTVIVLIGTGWSFLKPFLQDREKKVLMLVIPLQVVTNIASIVIGETGPFIRNWTTWVLVFIFVDVMCCCAVLFPIVWSIRSLRENSKSDGKAARNLAKLVLFRRFYLLVIGYLYSTRVFLVLLRAVLSYKYIWVCLVVEEGISLAFYVVMFWMFRPKVKNEYLALDDEEEEAAVAMAVLREEEEDI